MRLQRQAQELRYQGCDELNGSRVLQAIDYDKGPISVRPSEMGCYELRQPVRRQPQASRLTIRSAV